MIGKTSDDGDNGRLITDAEAEDYDRPAVANARIGMGII